MKSNWRWQLLSPVLALLLVLADQSDGLFDRVEYRIQDTLLRVQASWHPVPQDIVLIDIDQKSLEDLNTLAGSFPWPRSVQAELIEGLEAQNVQAIVFDLFFNEADTFRADSDALFRDTVARHDNIYLPTLLLNDGHGAPLTRLAMLAPSMHLQGTNPKAFAPLMLPLVTSPQSWRGGLANFTPDADGIGRHYLLYAQHAGWILPSLPQRLATDYHWSQPSGDRILINWFAHGLPRASFSDVYLDMDRRVHRRPANEFTGKIVVIGATAPGLSDFRATPMSTTTQAPMMLGTAISNLKHHDWLNPVPLRPWLGAVLLVLLAWGFWRGMSIWKIGLGLLAVTLVLAGISMLFLQQEHWMIEGLSGLAMAWTLMVAQAGLAYAMERADRVRTEALFSRFLDPNVVRALVAGGDAELAMRPSSRTITVLFSDIRGFTHLSELKTPESVLDLLNRYFRRQTAIIFKNRGTLDKFIGDAIMAFWNAPIDDPEHAVHAVQAALSMVEVLQAFCKDLGEAGENFDIGIGIHTGPAVVGFLGADERIDYTAIGDTVNLASRIEGQTRGRARVLVSESTRDACGSYFDFVDHGWVQVKGRDAQVHLYEPRRKEV